MARSGLYKSDIKKARDALVAQGQHPSVDAVRIALGNTGSKTTIHKYLKELEVEEDGAPDRKASISDALQDFVARLAAQLHTDADARIEAMQIQQVEQARQQADSLATLQRELAAARDQLQRLGAVFEEEQAAHAHTRDVLQGETVARHTAQQQVADLQERLEENASHRRSLEEKHQHAREALDHYRASVKEQRAQDLRRHEQQLQQLQAELRQAQQSLIVKQEDITRLNQEGARLVADLSHAQKALYDEKSTNRHLAQQLEALPAAQQRCALLEMQAVDKDAQASELRQQLAQALAQSNIHAAQIQTLQMAVTAAEAKLEAQHATMEQWRSAMEQWQTSSRKEQDQA